MFSHFSDFCISQHDNKKKKIECRVKKVWFVKLIIIEKHSGFIFFSLVSVYIDLGRGASDTATIALSFGDSSSSQNKWDIKVAQIPCGANYEYFCIFTFFNLHPLYDIDFFHRPPEGCLQWSTGLTGQITSFNFPTATGPHLRNQE